MAKTDLQLKQDVEAELVGDPRINAAQMGVTVDRGVVSLMGVVDSFAEKAAAQAAARHVGGVRAVAEELTVGVLAQHRQDDAPLARAALHALKWNVWVPANVTASVQRSAITLRGEVDWKFQRDAAERAVSHLEGVASVTNSISFRRSASAAAVQERVRAAIERQSQADARSIHVQASAGTVTLSGTASNWKAIDAAVQAAWAAHGVTEVVDEIVMVGDCRADRGPHGRVQPTG